MISGEPPQTPQKLRDWEKAVPGSAARLFDEYIDQIHHRRRMDTRDNALAFFGPVLGLVVVLAFLGTAAWLIHSGFRVEGTVLGSVDIVSLAAVFVAGADRQRSAQPAASATSVQATAELLPSQTD